MNMYRNIVKNTINAVLTHYEKTETWGRVCKTDLLDYIDKAHSAKLITTKEAIDFCIRAGAI